MGYSLTSGSCPWPIADGHTLNPFGGYLDGDLSTQPADPFDGRLQLALRGLVGCCLHPSSNGGRSVHEAFLSDPGLPPNHGAQSLTTSCRLPVVHHGECRSLPRKGRYKAEQSMFGPGKPQLPRARE
jgi:hypothetical protein